MSRPFSFLRIPLYRISILFAAAIALPFVSHAQSSSLILVSAPLPLESATTIPGRTLKPGTYSIRILDHFRDRYILRVDDGAGKPISTFIGLRNPEFIEGHGQGPIAWASAPHGAAALRGFSFPNGNTVEFVYPKAEAAALAQLNTSSVPAIDPESEGRPSDPKLSDEDRQVVTLWMLSATRVGPKNETPAIAAKKFQPEANITVAMNSEPAPVPARASARSAPVTAPAAPTETKVAASAPTQKPKAKRAIERLPQTGSELSLVLLASLLMIFGAFGLRTRRSIS